ncbi:MAG: cation transport ATPase, partial [Planctomycetota bacterium]
MSQEREAQVFSACIHCGLPLRGRPPVVEREQAFCCAGCGIAWSFCSDIEGEGDGSNQDRWLSRLMLSAFLSMGVMVFSLAGYGEGLEGGNLAERASDGAAALAGIQRLLAMALCVPVVHLLGLPLLLTVVRTRRFLSADGLIVVGVGAAGVVSVWNTLVSSGPVWFETVAMVLVLTSVGKWLDARAKGQAREALSPLMDKAEGPLCRIEGESEVDVDPSDIRIGDRVRMRPGEVASIDGRVLAGRAFVDSSVLTGESDPVSAGPGARLLAGSTVLDGCLEVEVIAVPGERVQDAVARLLEQAVQGSTGHVRLADRVARVLLPCVLVLAVGTFVVTLSSHGLEPAWQRALAVVLIACPCAIGIATPLAFWVALGQAWKRGVLVKGADVLERLARTRRVLLDKTGTLTDRRMKLTEIVVHAKHMDQASALALGAALEHGSEHPIGSALRLAHGDAGLPDCAQFKALPGVGVSGLVQGRELIMQRSTTPDLRTRVALSQEGELLAEFCLESAPVLGAGQVLA